MIQKEIQEKYVEMYQHFSFERLEKILDTLPDIIEMIEDGEWEYKYRDAPMGMKQSEIIGVKPKEKRLENFGNTFSISLFDNGREAPEEATKYIPSTTFKSIGGLDENSTASEGSY